MARKRVERNISYDNAKKRYYVCLDYGVINGKQEKKYKTCKTLAEARQTLREHLADKVKGALLVPQKITLSQWLEDWLANVVSMNNAESTMYGYNNIVNKINAELGNIALQELKPMHIQRYYTKQLKDGLSPNTVIKHYNLLYTALKFAVRQGIVNENVVEKTTPPKKTKAEISFYTKEQLKQLLSLVKGHRLEIVVALAIYYGLRREEIMGLTWSCIDLDNRTIRIKEARTMAGSKVIVKGTKNDSSTRVLYIVDEVKSLLETERIRQTENKKDFGRAYVQNDYVIVWENGKEYRPNYMSELFSKFVKENGLPPLTLHGLRHSFASLANASGVSLFDASKLLGHSTPATTGNIYTHMYDNALKEHSTLIANALSE